MYSNKFIAILSRRRIYSPTLILTTIYTKDFYKLVITRRKEIKKAKLYFIIETAYKVR